MTTRSPSSTRNSTSRSPRYTATRFFSFFVLMAEGQGAADGGPSADRQGLHEDQPDRRRASTPRAVLRASQGAAHLQRAVRRRPPPRKFVPEKTTHSEVPRVLLAAF